LQLLDKIAQRLNNPKRKLYRVILRERVLDKHTNESFLWTFRNISTSSILIETDKIIEKRDKISCSLFLPKSEQIIVHGEIVCIVKNPDGTTLWVVKYSSSDPKDKSEIEVFVTNRSAQK